MKKVRDRNSTVSETTNESKLSFLDTWRMNLQNINDIGHGQEVVNVMKKVGLSMPIREFSIELTFAERLTSHFEEANKVDGHTFRMI